MHEVTSADATVSRLDVGGVSYLVSVAALLGERTQGWLVGIVVPEAHYLGALDASRRRGLVDRGGARARVRRPARRSCCARCAATSDA